MYHSINTNIIGFVGCLLAMAPCCSHADDKDVVVVGSHDPMKAGSSATVDIDETVSKNATFGDLLLRFPGTVVRRFGGLGDYSGLSIRGSSTRQVEFFLQGIPLNPDGNSSVNLTELPLRMMKRLQVWRSNPPAHYYSSAIGGVVNAQVKERPGFSSTYSAGSFGWHRLSGHSSLGTLPGWVFVDTFRAIGKYPYFSNQATPFNPTDDGIFSRENNQKKQVNTLLFGKLGTVQLLHSTHLRQEGLPGTEVAQTLQTNLRTNGHLTAARWQRQGWRMTAWHHLRQELFRDPAAEQGQGKQENRYDNHGLGGDLGYLWANHSWFFPFVGMSVRHDIFGLTDLQNDIKNPRKNRQVVKPTLSFDTLLPKDLQFSVNSKLLLMQSTLQEDDIATFFPTFSSVLVWRYVPNMAIWVSMNRNIRPPTTTELFGQRGIVVGNERLLPEQSLLFDTGFTWKYRSMFNMQMAYFLSFNKDQIILVQNAQRIAVPLNFGQTEIQGVEVMTTFSPWSWLRLQGSATWNHSRNLAQQSLVYGNQLPNLPTWSLQHNSTFDYEKIQFGHSWFFVDQQYWDATNWYLAAPRSIHHLFVRCIFAKPWPLLELEVRNLADNIDEPVDVDPLQPELGQIKKSVTDFIGHPLAGRSVFLNLTWPSKPVTKKKRGT